jgi:hypothetical protein
MSNEIVAKLRDVKTLVAKLRDVKTLTKENVEAAIQFVNSTQHTVKERQTIARRLADIVTDKMSTHQIVTQIAQSDVFKEVNEDNRAAAVMSLWVKKQSDPIAEDALSKVRMLASAFGVCVQASSKQLSTVERQSLKRDCRYAWEQACAAAGTTLVNSVTEALNSSQVATDWNDALKVATAADQRISAASKPQTLNQAIPPAPATAPVSTTPAPASAPAAAATKPKPNCCGKIGLSPAACQLLELERQRRVLEHAYRGHFGPMRYGSPAHMQHMRIGTSRYGPVPLSMHERRLQRYAAEEAARRRNGSWPGMRLLLGPLYAAERAKRDPTFSFEDAYDAEIASSYGPASPHSYRAASPYSYRAASPYRYGPASPYRYGRSISRSGGPASRSVSRSSRSRQAVSRGRGGSRSASRSGNRGSRGSRGGRGSR